MIKHLGVPEGLIVLGLATAWLFFLLATMFWLWMLVDCWRWWQREPQKASRWLVAVALTHLAGAAWYFHQHVRPQGTRAQGLDAKS